VTFKSCNEFRNFFCIREGENFRTHREVIEISLENMILTFENPRIIERRKIKEKQKSETKLLSRSELQGLPKKVKKKFSKTEGYLHKILELTMERTYRKIYSKDRFEIVHNYEVQNIGKFDIVVLENNSLIDVAEIHDQGNFDSAVRKLQDVKDKYNCITRLVITKNSRTPKNANEICKKRCIQVLDGYKTLYQSMVE